MGSYVVARQSCMIHFYLKIVLVPALQHDDNRIEDVDESVRLVSVDGDAGEGLPVHKEVPEDVDPSEDHTALLFTPLHRVLWVVLHLEPGDRERIKISAEEMSQRVEHRGVRDEVGDSR